MRAPPRGRPRQRGGFSLIELLVVVLLIGLLLALLMPAIGRVRHQGQMTTCLSNLRQLGLGIEMFKLANDDRYPAARFIPPPFIDLDPDPPLPVRLRPYLGSNTAPTVFQCPKDVEWVHARAGISYSYESALSNETIESYFLVSDLGFRPEEVIVLRDFDRGTYDTEDGPLTIPKFHTFFNAYFGDGHVAPFD